MKGQQPVAGVAVAHCVPDIPDAVGDGRTVVDDQNVAAAVDAASGAVGTSSVSAAAQSDQWVRWLAGVLPSGAAWLVDASVVAVVAAVVVVVAAT